MHKNITYYHLYIWQFWWQDLNATLGSTKSITSFFKKKESGGDADYTQSAVCNQTAGFNATADFGIAQYNANTTTGEEKGRTILLKLEEEKVMSGQSFV